MIIYPKKFAEAKAAGFDGIFDWDFLLPAFAGTKIMPMDIDAIVERKGRFLIIETKESGKSIPQGQEITLKSLLNLGKGAVLVLILYGKTVNSIRAADIWSYKNGNILQSGLLSCNADDMLFYVGKWFRWADKRLPIY